jgi:hypothetical protein
VNPGRKVPSLDFAVNKKTASAVALGLLLVLLYKGSLDCAYATILTRNFLSQGYQLNLSPARMLLSYVLLLGTSSWLLVSFQSYRPPSSLVVFVLYLFLITPMLTLYGLADYPATFLVSCLGNFFLLIYLVKKPALRLCSFDSGFAFVAVAVLALITAYVYCFLIGTGGLGRLNFNFYNVYEVREELSELSAPLMGYFLSWQANVINMALLSVGFLKRWKFLVLFAIVLQVALFGMTNFKSFLLAPFLVTFIFYFFRAKRFFHLFLFALCCVSAAAYLIFLKTDEIMAVSLLTRRLFFVPAQLHAWYYEFFSGNTHVMLSNSVFAPFLKYPYEMPMPLVISWEYLQRDGGLNVGVLGDAFAHFGHAGMLLFTLLLGIFLKMVDGFAAALPANFCAAIIAIPAMSLLNSGLFTTLLTHGFLCAFFLLWLLSGGFSRFLTGHLSSGGSAPANIREESTCRL